MLSRKEKRKLEKTHKLENRKKSNGIKSKREIRSCLASLAIEISFSKSHTLTWYGRALLSCTVFI
jgi:hypothetical protein